MPGYNIEHTPTDSSNGGTLLCIKQEINYKLRKELQIYKSKELESTFVEVLEPGMSKNNMIIGCISVTLQWNSLSLIIIFFQYF